MTSGLEEQMELVLAEIRSVRKAMEEKVEVKTLTIPQAAIALNVSESTVKWLVRDGKLLPVLIASDRRIPVSEINRLATPRPTSRPSKKKPPVDWKSQGDEIRRRAKR